MLHSWLTPVLIGVLACVLVTGVAMLQPGNVHWLTHGDLAQSYLGWAFYRYAPWSWPLGANPLYGAGLHTSVYYSDSIPLLAILLKPLASWLPVPFQYFGLWVLACFVLQAWFAWRLLGLVTSDALVKLLGVLFFVFAPPMLARLDGHMALVGHWIVLAAIYLCVRPDRKRQTPWWMVLLAVAMMIHAYLFAMAAAIWLADVVRDDRTMSLAAPGVGASRFKTMLLRVAPVIVMALLAAWLAGLFMVSGHGTQAQGFGYYKMNVLAPINGNGWSRFGLNFPQAAGEYEGFNYFGVGGLAIILSALVISLMRGSSTRQLRLPVSLIVMAVLLAAAAVTCNIGIGALQWRMPLPQKWWDGLSRIPLQSTGRLFWVTYYVALLAALYVLLQVCSLRWQKMLLIGAVVLQCVDIGSGLSGLHARLSARAHDQSALGLHGVFWDEAGQRYTTLSVLPLSKRVDWEQLAFYANSHHMGMDGVQLARIDMDGFLVRYNLEQQALLSDRLAERSLYVLDDREVAVARKAIPVQRAALFQLDGKNVLAPGWTSPLPASAIDLRSAASTPSFELPFKGDFAPDGAGRLLLGEGWNATGEGLMSLSDAATVFVPGGDDAQRILRVEFDLHRANTGKSMAMGIEAWFEGKRIARCSMANNGCSVWRFDVPGAVNGEYFRKIELRPDTPKAKLRIALDGVAVQ